MPQLNTGKMTNELFRFVIIMTVTSLPTNTEHNYNEIFRNGIRS